MSDSSHNISKQVKIATLRNAIYYYLQFVYLIREESGCRLVVIHRGRILGDTKYKTVKGAKIAFFRHYGWRLRIKKVKPDWTSFYLSEDHRLSLRLGDIAIVSISIGVFLRNEHLQRNNYLLDSAKKNQCEGIDMWQITKNDRPQFFFDF